MRPTMTEITIIAITHGRIALTSPRPIPRIVKRISPAHSTKSENAKPVVAANMAVDEEIKSPILLRLYSYKIGSTLPEPSIPNF